jgi:hypothetical protein
MFTVARKVAMSSSVSKGFLKKPFAPASNATFLAPSVTTPEQKKSGVFDREIGSIGRVRFRYF